MQFLHQLVLATLNTSSLLIGAFQYEISPGNNTKWLHLATIVLCSLYLRSPSGGTTTQTKIY